MSREFGKILPRYWTGGSGAKLRKEHLPRLLGAYLFTAPTANPIGIFYLPIVAVMHELGCTLEEARAAMARLADPEIEIAMYDEEESLVWVPQMCAVAIGETMSPGDKRRPWLLKTLSAHRKHRFYNEFLAKYGESHGVLAALAAAARPARKSAQRAVKPLPDPSEAPSSVGELEMEMEMEMEISHTQRAGDDDEPPDEPGPASTAPPTLRPEAPRSAPATSRPAQPAAPTSPAPPATRRPEPATVDEAPPGPRQPTGEPPGGPDAAEVILARLQAAPAPLRYLATREHADQFAGIMGFTGARLEDVLNGIGAAGAKLGPHRNAKPDDPEALDALADHVGSFIANQRRRERARPRGQRIAEPADVERFLTAFGLAWSKAKRERFGRAEDDPDIAARVVVRSIEEASRSAVESGAPVPDDYPAEIRRFWVSRYLMDPGGKNNFLADAGHPLKLLPGQLGGYGLPPLAKKQVVRAPEPMSQAMPAPAAIMAKITSLGNGPLEGRLPPQRRA